MAVKANSWKTTSTIGLMLVGLALVITLLAGWFASQDRVSAITQDSLKQSVGSLKSYANESLYLTQQYEQGRTTGNFAKEAADKLYTATSSMAEELQSKPTSSNDINDKVKEVTDQANDLSDAMSELSRLPDQNKAQKIEQQVRNVASKAEELQK